MLFPVLGHLVVARLVCTHTLPGGRSLQKHTSTAHNIFTLFLFKQWRQVYCGVHLIRKEIILLVKCCFHFQLIIHFWKFNQESARNQNKLKQTATQQQKQILKQQDVTSPYLTLVVNCTPVLMMRGFCGCVGIHGCFSTTNELWKKTHTSIYNFTLTPRAWERTFKPQLAVFLLR